MIQNSNLSWNINIPKFSKVNNQKKFYKFQGKTTCLCIFDKIASNIHNSGDGIPEGDYISSNGKVKIDLKSEK